MTDTPSTSAACSCVPTCPHGDDCRCLVGCSRTLEPRRVGTLTADDIGSEIAVVHEGRLYVGALAKVEHTGPWTETGPARTNLHLVGDAGWRWYGLLESADTLADLPVKVVPPAVTS